jgi:hypothetical protein
MLSSAKKQSPKAPEWEAIEDELEWDDVGGRLLANIARGMYSHQGVLREYVQNAVDAYKALGLPSDEHKVVITPGKTSLSIQDFGIGMDDKGIREAKKIAVSNKGAFDDRVGFRGIGIWAGLPACKTLIVDSTKAGVPFRFRLIFDFAGIMQHLDDNINIKVLVDPRYRIERHVAEKDEHYTRVTLEDITNGYKQLLDVAELKRIASQVLPSALDPTFQHCSDLRAIVENWPGYHECHILVNTNAGQEEAFRKFPEDDVELPTERILHSDDGVELARAWYCRTKKTSLRDVEPPAQRGFQLRVKNFAVGEVNLFSAEQGYGYNIHDFQELKTASRLAWFCGEIQITNNDIKPNTPRDDLEREQAARLFIEKLRGFYKDRIVEAGAYSEFNPFRKALEDAEALVKAAKTKVIGDTKGKSTVDAIAVRKLLSKLGEAVNKSKGEPLDQSKKLFKELLRKPWFKDRSAKAVAALKRLLPAAPEDVKPKDAASEKGGSDNGGTNGKQKDKTKEKNTGAGADGNGAGAENATAKDAEQLISDIFAILEKRLGEEFEELPEIQVEIQQTIDAWFAAHAS